MTDEAQSKELHEFYWWMGITLAFIQQAEISLKSALQGPFLSGPKRVLTIEDLESEEEAVRLQTLGQLIKRVESRGRAAPELEEQLRDFCQHRNTFVHHAVERYDSRDPAQLAEGIAFFKLVVAKANWVVWAMTGIRFAWQRELLKNNPGLTFNLPEEVTAWAEELAAQWTTEEPED